MTQEDNTPVWIRGVPNRGKEVISMFKEFFNAKDWHVTDAEASDEHNILYLNCSAFIVALPDSTIMAKKIIDGKMGLEEIFLPVKERAWKYGDILIGRDTFDEAVIAIYNERVPIKALYFRPAFTYFCDGTIEWDLGWRRMDFRLATDADIKAFKTNLDYHGLRLYIDDKHIRIQPKRDLGILSIERLWT